MRMVISILTVGLLIASGVIRSEILQGEVVGVADGDTISVLDSAKVQNKIRLSRIYASERRQSYGNVSKQHLAGMVFGRTMLVDSSKRNRDRRYVTSAA